MNTTKYHRTAQGAYAATAHGCKGQAFDIEIRPVDFRSYFRADGLSPAGAKGWQVVIDGEVGEAPYATLREAKESVSGFCQYA